MFLHVFNTVGFLVLWGFKSSTFEREINFYLKSGKLPYKYANYENLKIVKDEKVSTCGAERSDGGEVKDIYKYSKYSIATRCS
jgi:hypothetical protein